MTFVELLAGSLDREPDLHCIGSALTARQGVEDAAALRPDVVLMDFHLPDESGITAAGRILSEAPDTRVVMLTGDPTTQALEAAATIGVCAFLPKYCSLADVLSAIRNARTGGILVHPSLLSQLGARAHHPPPSDRPVLTPRERDVLQLMAKGYDVRSNAQALQISENTCRGYVKAILSKLGAHTQLEAVVAATRLGLVGARQNA
jgi:DNA-binding NarL/FixJ family response regulator